MRNRYNINELVKVSGNGKIYGKIKNVLGFIIEKDIFYGDYYVELFNKNKDWFSQNEIKRVFKKEKNKTQKYQIRLCTTIEGYELIKKNLKENEPISNNKFRKKSFNRNFIKNEKKYIILGWNSVYWPISNKSIKIIENTIKSFRSLDIPFKYIVLNEDELNDIEIHEFVKNDRNVDIFKIERKIRIK